MARCRLSEGICFGVRVHLSVLLVKVMDLKWLFCGWNRGRRTKRMKLKRDVSEVYAAVQERDGVAG